MSWTLTLSAKGQLTIPKDLREALNLHPGDEVVYSIVNDELVITPKNIDFGDLAGLLGKPPNGPASLEEIDAAIVAAAGANVLDTGDDEQADAAE
ncbi:AbrB/MazE/SpoVT family DNA-binding domain-containing protein [Neorhizobium sp. CSC1952]|uniref:Looped-hinge helix DNA binding domain-containing protein, AbrB family n=1 Tax=Xaviernesmea oryzae TaxID=464029 RepID=A0A1X7CWT5_9HYPH|nr:MULTISPECIES: AbrB/MazE/SpoVT family DNA-binding domain-containing protein [Rhizobium/Agrobacterium group]WJR65658.1 AbrB/MazE/SpoVT family DNA-binding domain-containing protein [Rhizobium sp. CSC1952]SMF04567.1 looped-hinge helix DNA binding domain-containing protein, AbrB family [Xaviernesmea oryzae]